MTRSPTSGDRTGPDPATGRGPHPVVVALDGTVPPGLIGGKGAALDRLVAWGIPVPPAAAVTVHGYRHLVDDPGVAALLDDLRAGGEHPASEIDAAFAAARFDPDDAAAIVTTARSVAGGRRLAVRSSATVEDLASSSFAGQYRSLLGVDPSDDEALLGAVAAVFASLWHPAPRAYRRRFGIDDTTASMAAVLMAMVDPRRAGVVFTLDPGGDADRARVEWVEGLADDLVSGRRTPTVAVLARHGGRPEAPPGVTDALDLALEVERRAGCGQDVEWAWDGRRAWIVQARPITVAATRTDDGFDDPIAALDGMDLTTAGIGEMLPGVLPPLVWTIDAHLVEEAFRRVLDDLGLLGDDTPDERALLRRVRGRAAMDFTRLRSMVGALPGTASEDLEADYFGDAPPADAATGARRSHRRIAALRHDLRVLASRRRCTTDAALTIAATGEIVAARIDHGALDDGELLALHLRLLDLAQRGMTAELGVAADGAASHRRLRELLARRVGEVAGARLADEAVSHLGLAGLHGSGASAAVFAGATWEELGRTPPYDGRPRDADDRDQAIERVLDALRSSEGWDENALVNRLRLRALRRLAREAAERLALRETTKASLLALGGEVRRIHLEAGRRLVARDVLDEPSEVDLLGVAEMRTALAGGPTTVTRDLLARRQRARRHDEQAGALPPRFSGVPTSQPVQHLDGRRLEGWAASGGTFRGRVQVVEAPDADLAPDAVLVAEATDPSWSPLFLRAGALVLDRGGPLSHAAILARELGLPAVLNVPGAAQLLDGREVTVDGDRGIVIVHDEAEP